MIQSGAYMQFTVIARDHANILERRMANRPEHLAGIMALKAAGQLVDAGAMLGDDGGMIGSIVTYEVVDRAELDNLLRAEIFVTAGVWGDIEIIPVRRAAI